ncbi:hypothetical protein BN77_3584 [Rhizobium mesoamericanum STM3625]|uniref:Uncharacterized protein n=1 Tax=Rhizobium mesoamericanum STM3625 TaxID=1211777 RepID=K0Q266_9HYPH|nr:hypothetical protein BN77_3584 [Rhizobium mesoamericanum STM3625]
MTGSLENKKAAWRFPGGSLVVFGHDWSRPPQRAHHQTAMFKDVVMGGIVSVRSGQAQEPESGNEEGRRNGRPSHRDCRFRTSPSQ